MDYFAMSDEMVAPTQFYSLSELQVTPSGNDSDLQCNSYRSNSTIVIIPGGYEGIPQNLLINFIAWLVIAMLS